MKKRHFMVCYRFVNGADVYHFSTGIEVEFLSTDNHHQKVTRIWNALREEHNKDSEALAVTKGSISRNTVHIEGITSLD